MPAPSGCRCKRCHNLNATGLAPDIIRALSGEMVVTANACKPNFARGTRNGHKDGKKLQALIEQGPCVWSNLGRPGNAHLWQPR